MADGAETSSARASRFRRLRVAREQAGAETLHYEDIGSVREALEELTGGREPDAWIDAVGMESHHHGPLYAYDRLKQAPRLESDRPFALREAIMRGSAPGQCHVHRYLRPLLESIETGQIDPRFVISDVLPLDQAPQAYEIFKRKQDDCLKVVLKP